MTRDELILLKSKVNEMKHDLQLEGDAKQIISLYREDGIRLDIYKSLSILEKKIDLYLSDIPRLRTPVEAQSESVQAQNGIKSKFV